MTSDGDKVPFASVWSDLQGVAFDQGYVDAAGIRTPEPVAQLAKEMPAAYKELDKIRATLEKHFTDVQDFEFTIQDGKVFMLQTRNGKRTAFAALKFSMDMVKEKLIDWKTAIRRNPAGKSQRGARRPTYQVLPYR